MTAAAMIGNRIPLNTEAVDPFEIAGIFPLYKRIGGSED